MSNPEPESRNARLPPGKRLKIALASAGGALLMRAIGATVRWRPQALDHLDPLRAEGSLLFALFHGDHFPVLYAYRGTGSYVITSQSADGQILTNILARFGYQTVRGSSSRGGARALVALARIVRAGHDAAIAVDGPKGPRRLVKPGIVLLAKLTGRPIVPLAGAARRAWQVNSWDRYCIPKPFTTALTLVGPTMTVPRDADDALVEARRAELERTLIQLQSEAEAKAREA